MKKRPALVVIDVQQGFNDATWGERNNPQAEANIARLLSTWRACGSPLFHVQHDSTSEHGSFRPGTQGHAHKPEALPLTGEPVYHKAVNSAFIGTTLEADLRRDGIGEVIICGLITNHCVSTTARMSGNLGFRTYVVSDATATFDREGPDGLIRSAEEVHAAALSDLHEEFATIITTAEAQALAGGGFAAPAEGPAGETAGTLTQSSSPGQSYVDREAVLIAIREAVADDDAGIWELLEPIVRSGESLALDQAATREEVLRYWRAPGSKVYVAQVDGSIVGTYFLRANAGGGGVHVANCGYATRQSCRGLGIGSTMCLCSLKDAKDLGFISMVFNYVIASNTAAVSLWRKLGFRENGRLTNAFTRPDGTFVDVLSMQRGL